MTENYTPPATWQRWADEGGTMAILTVQESAKMLKRAANGVMDGQALPLSPSYARAILDVLAALETVTSERDELSSLLAANVVVRAAQKLELDGITAERDALKATMEPDWKNAPEWAQWYAYDEDGAQYWYASEPALAGKCWGPDSVCQYIEPAPIDWRDSLRQRPVTEVSP